MLKQILISLALLTLPALAQTQPPDCPLQQAVLTAPGNLQLDNRSLACDSWTVAYVADTGATVSLVFQSTNGQSLPGTWATYTGNTSNSSASFGTAVSGIATYCGLATCVPSMGVTVETSWVRVHVGTLSGGTLRVFFYGYRTGYAAGLSGGGGGGGGSGCPNPCPILQSTTSNTSATWNSGTMTGTTVAITNVNSYPNVTVSTVNAGSVTGGIVTFEASPDGSTWIGIGMAPLGGTGTLATVYPLANGTNAFQMYAGGLPNFRVRLSTAITGAGSVTVNVAATSGTTEFPQYIATDSGNRATVVAQGTAAPGAAAGNPVMTGTRDDSNNAVADHDFPSQADITGSSVSAIKIVAGVSAKKIYVGHLSVSLAAGTTVSIIEGTTSSTPCDTGASTIAGPYQNAVALALDFTRDDALQTATNADDLCLSFGGSSTGGGLVKYSQR